ncbi:hypothetical protein AB0L34_19490 [Micromonospora sp. NPDC052213]
METPPVRLSDEPDQQPEQSRASAPSTTPPQPTVGVDSVPPYDDGYEAL